MSKHKPVATIVTIGRNGVYDLKRKVYYYAVWMLQYIGTKVCVFSDMFNASNVHIHDADTMTFMGVATQRETAFSVIKNNVPIRKANNSLYL